LAHLPSREQILDRLINTLVEGAVILVQDWRMTAVDGFVIQAPTDSAAAVLRRAYTTYRWTLRKFGFSSSWAADTHDRLIGRGLVDVATHVHGDVSDYQWRGGSAGANYLAASLAQVSGALIANGMTGVDLDQVSSLLGDPRVVIRGHQLYSTSGRKSGSNPHVTKKAAR
jgi:hypothetical protein